MQKATTDPDRSSLEALTPAERDALRALHSAVGVHGAASRYVVVGPQAQANALAGLPIRRTTAKLIRDGLAKRAMELDPMRLPRVVDTEIDPTCVCREGGGHKAGRKGPTADCDAQRYWIPRAAKQIAAEVTFKPAKDSGFHRSAASNVMPDYGGDFGPKAGES